MLRAELMEDDYWWWKVYDMLDNENQIDSSNEFDKQIISGEKAEEIAKDYLKNELTNKLQGSEEKLILTN